MTTTTLAAPGHRREPLRATAPAPAEAAHDDAATAEAGLPRYLVALQRKCDRCAGAAGDDEPPRQAPQGAALQAESGPPGPAAGAHPASAGAPGHEAGRGAAGDRAGQDTWPAAAGRDARVRHDGAPPDTTRPHGPPARDAHDAGALHAIAAAGVAQAGQALPHRERIQAAFGRHDVSAVRAQVGGPAADAARALGAHAYAHAGVLGFRSEPDLRLAAHEAAHTVQQRAGAGPEGGVGRPGDAYERHADAVADAVAGGGPAEALLDRVAPPRTTARSPGSAGRHSGMAERADGASLDTGAGASAEGAAPDGRPPPVPAAFQTDAGPADRNDGGARQGLQFACACGSCAHCVARREPPSAPGISPSALQFELDPLAERSYDTESPVFAPHRRAPAGGGGGAGGGAPGGEGGAAAAGGGATPVAPGAAAGPAGPAAGPGADGAPGAGAAGGGSPGAAGGGAAAAGSAPPDPAAAAAAAKRCPPIADRPPPEPGEAAEPEDACNEKPPVDNRSAQQKTEDAEKEKRGESAPDEPAAGEIKSEGQVRPPPGQATPPAPPPPPAPPTPPECESPAPAPAPSAPPAAPPAETPAPVLDAPFDPAREQAIVEARQRRALRVAESDTTLARVDAARARVDAESVSSVRYAEGDGSPEAALARAEATASTMRTFSAGLAPARELARRLREDAPARIARALRDAKGEVEAARVRETRRVAGSFAAARAAARRDAAATRAHIDMQFGLAVLRAVAATAAAVGRVETARAGASAQVDGAESDGLSRLDEAVTKAQADLRKVGTERGDDAMKIGRRSHAVYKSGRINRRDSWSAGYLTDRRADARAKAALTTASGFRDSFAQQAENQAFQFGRAKSGKCGQIVRTAFATRAALDTQAATFKGMVGDALAPQIAAAGQTRSSLRAAVGVALADQLAVLSSQQKAQLQGIADTAFLQQAALEEEAHGASARLLGGATRSCDEVTEAHAALRGVLEGRAAPPAALLGPALALVGARVAAALGAVRERLADGLAAIESTLAERHGKATVDLARQATGGVRAAHAGASSFATSLSAMRSQAGETFRAVADGYDTQLADLTTAAGAAFACAAAQAKASIDATVGDVATEATEQRNSLEKSFRESLATVAGKISDSACKAAEKEQPAWKAVVAFILIVLIIVIAIALTGPLAAALAGGTATFLSTVAAGAIIGALSAAAIQMTNNWAAGQAVFQMNVVRAAATGAIAGAFGGAAGAWAGNAATFGGAIVRQVATDIAGGLVAQVGTGLIFDGRLAMPEMPGLKDLAMSVFMAAVFSRRNVRDPSTGRITGSESYIGAAHTGAGGLRGRAWRGTAAVQEAGHGVAGAFMPGGRLRRGAAKPGDEAPSLPGAEPVAVPRAEAPPRAVPDATPPPRQAAGPAARPPETPAARPLPEPTARPASEPTARAVPEPAVRPAATEPAAPTGASRESPLGPRPESVTEVGVGDHRVYARRGPDGRTEIGLCSGACGPLIGKIDDMAPHATPELRGRLAALRERAGALQERVDRGEVARGADLDAHMAALTAELRGVAGEHPALRAMMDSPPLPAPAVPRVPAGPRAHVADALPAHVAPAEPVPAAKPGANEAALRASLPEAQRVGLDRWMGEVRASGGDPEAVLARMGPERGRAVAEQFARKHATEVARAAEAARVRAAATGDPLNPPMRVTETHGDVTVRYETTPPSSAEIAHAQRIAAATGEKVHLFGDTAGGVSYPGIDGTIGVPPRPLQLKTGAPDANAGWPRAMAQRARASAEAAGYSHVEVEISMPGKTVAEVRAAWDAPPARPTDDPLVPVYEGDALWRVAVRCSDGVFTPPREAAPPPGTPPSGSRPPPGTPPPGGTPPGGSPPSTRGAAPASGTPTAGAPRAGGAAAAAVAEPVPTAAAGAGTAPPRSGAAVVDPHAPVTPPRTTGRSEVAPAATPGGPARLPGPPSAAARTTAPQRLLGPGGPPPRSVEAAGRRVSDAGEAHVRAKAQLDNARARLAAAEADLAAALQLRAEGGRSPLAREYVAEARTAVREAGAELRALQGSEAGARVEHAEARRALDRLVQLESDLSAIDAQMARELDPPGGFTREQIAEGRRRNMVPLAEPRLQPSGARYHQLGTRRARVLAEVVSETAGLTRSVAAQVEAATPGRSARSAALANAQELPPALRPKDGVPIDVTTGAPMRSADWATDHIVSRSEIARDPRFMRLTPLQRDAMLLDVPDNYLPLTPAANSSKGARTVDDWIAARQAEGKPLPRDVADALRVADRRARSAVEAMFNRFLTP